MSEEKPKEGWTGIGKWWYASAFLMVIVALGFVYVVFIPDGDDNDDGAARRSSAEASPTPDDGVGEDPPDGPVGFVTLPTPTDRTGPYPTHYPQTPEGAAATVAAYALASATLDYDQTNATVRAYLSGVEDPRAMADGLVAQGRENLDIPLSGPPPAGVKVSTEVEGVKWREVDSTHVVVSLNLRFEYTLADGTSFEATNASGGAVVWSEGRWWVSGDPDQAPPPEKYAKPGTAAFESGGWKIIRNADWTGGAL